MWTIHKFPLLLHGTQILQFPPDAKMLSVAEQRDTLCLWALLDTTAPTVPWIVEIAGTGQPHLRVDPAAFVGTVQLGDHVWHVFVTRLRGVA